jgi:CRP/FNR family cyclic AMP-dependent transcriptional regulator
LALGRLILASARESKSSSKQQLRAGARPLSTGITLLERKLVPPKFNPAEFLTNAGLGKTLHSFNKKQEVFSQGEKANSIFYIQQGRVKLSVVSKDGKEATIAVLGPGEFVGEDCVAAAYSVRLATAVALSEVVALRIEREQMLRALHQEHEFSDAFCAFLLARNARIQADLVDQLFNSSEKRLARMLLLLAQFGKTDKPEKVIPNLSHQMLAQMIGTTRPRVTFFMNRFRKLGFITYNGEMQIHSSLLNVLLHD